MDEDSIRRGLAQAAAGQTTERPDLLMSERMVIVIEYDTTIDLGQPRTEAITQIKEGANRLNPGHFVQLHVAIKESADQVLAVFEP
jgi:hypothetical protein